MQIGFTKADTDTVKEGAFLDGHEGRGVGGQCLFPQGMGEGLLLLLALPWAWVRGALPSTKA